MNLLIDIIMKDFVKELAKNCGEVIAIGPKTAELLKQQAHINICEKELHHDSALPVRGNSWALVNEYPGQSTPGTRICFFKCGNDFYACELKMCALRDRATKKVVAIGSENALFMWVLDHQSQSYDWAMRWTYIMELWTPEVKELPVTVFGSGPRPSHDLGGTGHGDDSHSDADPGL